MPRSKRVEEFVKKELPYKILMKLYEDSRTPIKRMGKEFGISYHLVGKVLRELEEKYKLAYTLEIDPVKLGFSESKIITIKFEKTPSIEELKRLLQNDIFVQDAYLATGDFDLFLYVVGLTQLDFQQWQWNLRTKFNVYRPIFKTSVVALFDSGFLPIRSELIAENFLLSNTEKKILMLMNENSRMKLKELIKNSKTTQMKVIYSIRKMMNMHIIKKFSALVQNPEKRLLLAYSALLFPLPIHKKLFVEFKEKLLEEDFHEATNDYGLIADVNGATDAFFICTFVNGEVAAKRGPNMIEELWSPESPKIEKAILTDLIVGKWPFHLEGYEEFKGDMKEKSAGLQ